jgi:hypothetical protein
MMADSASEVLSRAGTQKYGKDTGISYSRFLLTSDPLFLIFNSSQSTFFVRWAKSVEFSWLSQPERVCRPSGSLRCRARRMHSWNIWALSETQTTKGAINITGQVIALRGWANRDRFVRKAGPSEADWAGHRGHLILLLLLSRGKMKKFYFLQIRQVRKSSSFCRYLFWLIPLRIHV